MEDDLISKEDLSKVLSEKTGRVIKIVSVERIGEGYHSKGFKASASNGESFFVKKFKSEAQGFSFPERKIFSLLVSDSMGKRIGNKPKSIGVLLANNNNPEFVSKIDENTDFYHVQEYEELGESYFDMLKGRKQKKQITDSDKEEIRKVVDYIAGVHSIKYYSNDEKVKKEAYNDGLRSVINNPETTFVILGELEKDYPILNREEQKEYLGLMYDLMHKWRNRFERLSALHGDFWAGNVFFGKDGEMKVIDYSRIPWGDPGIDIGWWLALYIWNYFETRNPYFKELGEFFLDEYEKRTGDKEIRKAVSIILGLQGLIFIFPKFYPDIDISLGRRFIGHIKKILREGRFSWD